MERNQAMNVLYYCDTSKLEFVFSLTKENDINIWFLELSCVCVFVSKISGLLSLLMSNSMLCQYSLVLTMILPQNSVNARYQTIPFPWLVFGEKVKVNTVFIRDSTGVSDSILILFGGALSCGVQVITPNIYNGVN